MFRPTHCIIHLSALRHNFRELKKKAPHHFLMGMVKANAYGHGSVEVAKVLAEEGAPLLGVASVEEGIELRNAGIQTPILCLGGPLGASAQDLIEHQLSPVVFNRESVEKLCSE
ncbi:MAG: alanine racemase [Deltaproteobacteria bacterium]|nr:alanine racemase [Deltaproteobacteria bacterium]